MGEGVEGAIWGLLVGDALGVPYEFHAAHDLPPRDSLEMEPPSGFARSHRSVPPGTWSDDGAHALALLASLLERGGVDLDDLGRRLVSWHENGAYAVGGVVFDVGIQTAAAIRAMASGVAAERAGGTGEQSNGNGSLMRVLPLALWHRGTDAELVHDAQRQSLVTHAHPRSQVGCALYSLWARRTLEGAEDPWSAATTALRAIYRDDRERSRELDDAFRPDDPAPGKGTGYVVDSLRSARWAVAQGAYEAAVRAAISLGNDTDTTACIAGGIAGLRDGMSAIPARWRAALRGSALVTPMIASLVKTREARA